MAPAKSILLLTVILLYNSLSAQQATPAFGKITLADLRLKECPFEQNAPAMVLLDEEVVSFWQESSAIKVITEKRVRIKIFSEKGLTYADIKIPYLSRKRGTKMKEISGFSYTLDSTGNIVTQKVDKKQIFRDKLDEDIRKLSFAFPGIKPGSIIEYRYTKVETNYFHVNPWLIQDLIPVLLATYTITVPPNIDIDYRVKTKMAIQKKDTLIPLRFMMGNERHLSFSAQQIPSFRKEPYMSSLEDNIHRIEFSMNSTGFIQVRFGKNLEWAMLNHYVYYSSFYGKQIEKPINGTATIIDSVKKINSLDEKISYLYQYLRKQLKWDGTHSYYADDLQECWNAKTGNNSELNLILLNLLKKSGIACKGLLVSTRENGMIDKEFVTMRQFNGIDVWVPDSNYVYILDLTQKYTSHRVPPYDITFRNAFAIDSTQGTWIYISDDRPLMKTMVSVKAQFDSTEKISGQAAIFSYDFAKMEQLQSREKEKKAEEEEEERSRKLIDLSTSDYTDENADDILKPLLEKFNFTYKVTQTNNFYYFQPLFLASVRDNPFTAATRQTDIDMGCNQQFIFQMALTIPPAMAYENLPPGILLRNSDSSIIFKRQSIIEEQQAFIKITIEYNFPHFKKEEYASVKEFFKKMYALLNEQIVLRKIK